MSLNRSVCATYELRGQFSPDFLLCEGGGGGPATHIIIPFVIFLFHHDVAWTILTIGLGEMTKVIIWFILLPHFEDFFLLFRTFETMAGSFIGVWLISGGLGMLTSYLFTQSLAAPILLPLTETNWKHRWRYYVPLYAVTLVYLLGFWVHPPGCENYVPGACINYGFMLATVLHVAFAILTIQWWLVNGRSKKRIWDPAHFTSTRRWWFLGGWISFVLFIGIQNWEPIIPIFFFPLIGQWAQVWLALAIWISVWLVVVRLWYHRPRTAFT